MIDQRRALAERLVQPAQVPSSDSVGDDLPPYAEAFLAHLRLLVGVPFTYLVPDARLLPDESIRFFYVDRNWTDRVVDGAVAVGKVGTRELAHHAAHAKAIRAALDGGEQIVRDAQRRRVGDWKTERPAAEAHTITGFLLRSALVSGWPHLEARAFAAGHRLPLARFERLSGGVMIALFFGVPDRVELEEPHNGVQFGVTIADGGTRRVSLRKPDGERYLSGGTPVEVPVPMRAGGKGVVHVAALRRALHARRVGGSPPEDAPIAQSGSAAFALTVLNPPYRQPFAGEGEPPSPGEAVADRVLAPDLVEALKMWVKRG